MISPKGRNELFFFHQVTKIDFDELFLKFSEKKHFSNDVDNLP